MKKLAVKTLPFALGLLMAGQGFSQDLVSDCSKEFLTKFASATKMEINDACAWDKVTTLEQAVAIQKNVVNEWVAQGATPIGYKVTSAADGRVIGTILNSMVIPSGSEVSLASGASLVSEADILVRVKDDGINSATTLEEVVKHLDAVIPLIESSDMMVATGIERTIASWTATNGNARWAIAGEPVAIDGSPEWVEKIANLTAVFTDETGKEMSNTKMAYNPLESVLTVLDSFKQRGLGESLKAGDLISLGNFGRPMRPKAGQTFTATYLGLVETPVTVQAIYK